MVYHQILQSWVNTSQTAMLAFSDQSHKKSPSQTENPALTESQASHNPEIDPIITNFCHV